MTKAARDVKRLKVWTMPPLVSRFCFRPDWYFLSRSEGETRFQVRRRYRRLESAKG